MSSELEAFRVILRKITIYFSTGRLKRTLLLGQKKYKMKRFNWKNFITFNYLRSQTVYFNDTLGANDRHLAYKTREAARVR